MNPETGPNVYISCGWGLTKDRKYVVLSVCASPLIWSTSPNSLLAPIFISVNFDIVYRTQTHIIGLTKYDILSNRRVVIMYNYGLHEFSTTFPRTFGRSCSAVFAKLPRGSDRWAPPPSDVTHVCSSAVIQLFETSRTPECPSVAFSWSVKDPEQPSDVLSGYKYGASWDTVRTTNSVERYARYDCVFIWNPVWNSPTPGTEDNNIWESASHCIGVSNTAINFRNLLIQLKR